jgi:hypothetical protein
VKRDSEKEKNEVIAKIDTHRKERKEKGKKRRQLQ